MNKEARDNSILPIDMFEYTFMPKIGYGANEWLKQSYEHIKGLPEFDDAIDC